MSTPLNDVGELAQLVVNHIHAGHQLDDARLVTDLDTLITDARRALATVRPPATQEEREAFLVMEVAAISRRLENIVGALDDLTATIATLTTDEATENAEVLAAVQKLTDAGAAQAALQATIDSLTAGDAITEAALADLNTQSAAIDTHLNASAAALAPVVT